ncbi:MAG: hypothetical protein ACRD3T_13215 [Terriglobia bacterium]
MRWPSQWQNPSALALLRGTGINYLLFDKNAELDAVMVAARRQGIQVDEPASATAEIKTITGLWPGARLSQAGDADRVSTGPTGLPWVDSNGWRVRVASALNPLHAIWVDAQPTSPTPGSYPLCVADTAACGGRWIVTLDNRLASGIAGGNRDALDTWRSLGSATSFFAAHSHWADYVPEAVIGIISNFSSKNESQEFLNLLTRTTEQYRLIPKMKFSASSLNGLRAVLWYDADPPGRDARKQILDFVARGGLLIARPGWGDMPGLPDRWDYPRYTLRLFEKGRIAIAKSADTADPYLLASDTVVLVSHRYDLLRFWDAGAVGAYLSAAPSHDRALVQMLFFARAMNGKASKGGPQTATVEVAGRYQTAKLLTPDESVTLHELSGSKAGTEVGMEIKSQTVELHLPPLSYYGALELAG